MEKLAEVLGKLGAFAFIGLVLMVVALGGNYVHAAPSDKRVVEILFWLAVGLSVLSAAMSDDKKKDK